jgi:hypothetical protein
LAFADAYQMLNTQIGVFIGLPLVSLDRLALHKRSADIRQVKE